MEKDKEKKKSYYDYSLLFIVVFLLCFGLIMLYSSSSYSAQLKFGSSLHFLKKQAVASALGIVVMIFVSFVDYHILKKFSFLLYLASFVLIALVLTPIGIEAYGARRWISVLGVSIQPAEYAKLVVIIFLAYILSKSSRQSGQLKYVFKIILIFLPCAIFLLVVTKNLSSALIIMCIVIVMLFVVSPKYSHYIGLAAIGISGVTAFLLLAGGYRLERVRVWLNPEEYSMEGGYQVLQGLYAIGSGGIFGKGLGQSIQKLGFVPEAQNDMIFSIICEELGLFGAIAVIVLFIFLIWRFMVIAGNAEDLFGSMLLVGIMTHISVQVLLNIAVVTNTIPNTGITLPFISYGGTSIVFLLAEMGIALSVSRGIKREK